VRDGLGCVAARRADLGVIALVVVRVDVRRGVGQVKLEGVPGRGREVDVAVAEALFELIKKCEGSYDRCSLLSWRYSERLNKTGAVA
jgi:hypothetical protein